LQWAEEGGRRAHLDGFQRRDRSAGCGHELSGRHQEASDDKDGRTENSTPVHLCQHIGCGPRSRECHESAGTADAEDGENADVPGVDRRKGTTDGFTLQLRGRT